MLALTIIGLLLLIYVLVKFLAMLWRILWPYVLARPKNLEQLAGKGTWAMVTGCTDGIGRAYAEELATRGISLILVSRSAQKLAQMEEEFRRRFQKPDYLTIPFDFSETSVDEYRHKLLHRIKHLEIGILVNNVGSAYDYFQRFHDAEGGAERMAQIMAINIFPVTLLTAHVLDQMTRRGRGIIVNVSSVLAYMPGYFVALYGATKAYVNWLMAAIHLEYGQQKGIIIQTLTPGLVVTKMSRMMSEGKKPSLFMPSAQQFARSAVRTIGNTDETTGAIGHQIQKEIFGCLPRFLANIAMKKTAHKAQKDWLKKTHPLSA